MVAEDTDPKLDMLAVGDLMMGCAYFHTLVNDSIPDRLDNGEPLISHEVAETLTDSDLLFGNLECVVSEEFDKRDGVVPPRLMAPVESLEVLEQCEFNILNLANNHILDHGPELVEETKKRLDERGISSIGNPLENQRGLCLEWQGNEIQLAGFYVPSLSDKQKKEEVRSFVNDSQGENQLTIVSLHWGLGMEHMRYPSPKQVTFARELVDQGADVILGHHSHTFQPVEEYEDGIIAYSLGNFIFDMWRKENRSSGILKLTIDTDLNIDSSILPTEQVDYTVRLTDDEFLRETLNMPVKPRSSKSYQKTAKKVRRNHRLQVIQKYLVNSHKFPLEFHISTWRRWVNKAIDEKVK
jgi:gamma-polyglutamate biosynthesis protein CapA